MKICTQCENQYPPDVRFCPMDGATLRAVEAGADLVGQVIADRYAVQAKLGEGGMGQVYLAEHVRMGRRSALKVMHPGMMHDADAIARFNREASNASRISHPNVAAIYDFGETSDGLIYLAMEFVEGEPLTAVVERQGALPAPRAAAIAAQVAQALAAAHDMGIVHRDLKPDNIMIARGRDGADVVKVVDFGIAKASDASTQRVTRTGFIVGTPEYMSPEQLSGDRLDGRSDIYALGLVTFHLLTGTLPFPSATMQESMIMRLTERPRTLAEARAGVRWPAEMQQVLDRALARDAKLRYADAREFAADLERAIARMPEIEAASAGTLVMSGPLPATRVAPNAGGTRIAGAAPARAATPAMTASRAVPAVAALVLIAAIAAGATWFTIGRGAPGGDSADAAPVTMLAGRDPGKETATSSLTRPPIATSDARVERGAGDPDAGMDRAREAGVSLPPDSGRVRERRGEPPSEQPTGASTSVFLARPALDALEALVDIDNPSDARARQALDMVDSVLPKLTDAAHILEARYRRAEAYVMLNEANRACSELEAIRPGAESRAGGVSQSIVALHTAICRPQS